jgi:ribosomal subunit interface protein
MHLYLTARHLELTDALRQHVQRHLVAAIDAHGARAVRMEVQLYRMSDRDRGYGCHVLLDLSRRHEINIREEDHDLYEAIDRAQKRLVRSFTELRDRRLTESRHARKYTLGRLARALGWSGRRFQA